MQEMRISLLVLDPTSDADSKNLKAGSSTCLAVNTALATAIKCPTPLVASRRSTPPTETQGKDADTNKRCRVAAINQHVGLHDKGSKPLS